MAKPTQSDIKAFGAMVRERRQAARLSQEALAAAALGNPERKSYISAIENNRRQGLTPETAERLSVALGLEPNDVPASLRWTTARGATSPFEERLSAIETIVANAPPVDDATIARAFNQQLARNAARSLNQAYTDRLAKGLLRLEYWFGAPFSARSFAVSWSLVFVYTAVIGLIGYAAADGAPLALPFHNTDLSSTWSPWLVTLVALCCVGLGGWICLRVLAPIGQLQESANRIAFRMVAAALTAGISCAVIDL